MHVSAVAKYIVKVIVILCEKVRTQDVLWPKEAIRYCGRQFALLSVLLLLFFN